jgi:hypothetical protein
MLLLAGTGQIKRMFSPCWFSTPLIPVQYCDSATEKVHGTFWGRELVAVNRPFVTPLHLADTILSHYKTC